MGPRVRGQRERGASLIEFAIVLPLLLTLLLGIVEFGWAFAQNLDVKHVAREVGRLATVDADTATIQARACGGDLAAVQTVTRSGDASAGGTATVTVSAELRQITGLFGPFLNPVGPLTSTVEIRLEQNATQWNGTTSCP